MGNSLCSNEYGRRRPQQGSYPPLARNCCTRDKTGSEFSPTPAEQDDRSIPEGTVPFDHTLHITKADVKQEIHRRCRSSITDVQSDALTVVASAVASGDADKATHEAAALDSPISKLKLEFALELANDATLKLTRAKEEALNSPGTLMHLEIDQQIDKLEAFKGKLDELRVVEQRKKDWYVENAAAGKGKIGRLLLKLEDTEMENSVLGGVAECNAAAAAAYKIALLAAQANTVAVEAETCTDTAIETDALDALETAQLAVKKEEARVARLEDRLDTMVLLKLASDLELAKLTSTELSKFQGSDDHRVTLITDAESIGQARNPPTATRWLPQDLDIPIVPNTTKIPKPQSSKIPILIVPNTTKIPKPQSSQTARKSQMFQIPPEVKSR